ncbi:MAG: hypothetical protein M3N43_08720 [Actinomycetota bacterium]|nr:hypothetical protein [Actinomycetota bacterium]
MDPAWWKSASQVLVFAASAVAGAGAGAGWYFGRVDDQVKERAARQRETALSAQVSELLQSNGRLESHNAALSLKVEAIHAGINELVSRGRLSRQDAQKLIHVIISESLSLQENLQVELKRGTPGSRPDEK